MTNLQLRRLRRETLRLTQAALAGLLGVRRMTVARWEQGTHPIPPLAASLFKLLEADPARSTSVLAARTERGGLTRRAS